MANGKSTENSSDDFEAAATQTVAALEPGPVADAAPAEPASAPPSAPAPDVSGDRLLVQREWARGCVALCFYPMYARDPRWRLTEFEADGAAGPMQEFLQAALDRYLPEWIGKYAPKNPELARLILALGIVWWSKAKSVAAMPKPEAAPAAETPAGEVAA